MKFSVWDIETENWNQITYIGYYNETEQGVVKTVGEIIEIMERIGGVFFAHAAGIFDNKFLLDTILRRYNLKDINIKLIHNNIGHIEIKDKFTLRDSYYLFPDSLAKLAIGFKVGQKMDMDRSNMAQYAKEQVIEYVLSDCILLYKVLKQAEISGFDLNNITIAQATFKNWKTTISKLDLVNMQMLDRLDPILRNAYFGGRTEVFRRYGQNLNYYDVHSMYPYVMKNFDYPYGLSIHTNTYEKGKLGIYNVFVSIPKNCYLPPVPYREEKSNKVLFPVGKFQTWLTNIEIELLKTIKGARFEVIKGFYWEYKFKPFDNYIDYWYNIKQNSDGALYEIAKKHLNCLYGKFGQRRIFNKIVFEPPESVDKMIDLNYNLLFYDGDFEKNDIMNVDPDKLQVWSHDEASHIPYTYVQIAIFITAYARRHLYNIMKSILDKKGNIFYCDTDSVFTDIQLETGDKLGDLGKENKQIISEAVFISPKLYAYIDGNKETVKAKGCNIESLNYELMKLILGGSQIESKKESLIGFLESVKRKKHWLEVRVLKRTIDNKFSKRKIINDYNTLPLILK